MPGTNARSKLLDRSGPGRRLKIVRTFFRLSQSEFADEAGIGRERLASYETGRVPLPLSVALSLCRRFVIGEYWLATGENHIMGGPIEMFGSSPARMCLSLAFNPRLLALDGAMPFTDAFTLEGKKAYCESFPEWTLFGGRFCFTKTDPPSMALRVIEHFTAKWIDQVPAGKRTVFTRQLIRWGSALYDVIQDMGIMDLDGEIRFDNPQVVNEELTRVFSNLLIPTWSSLRQRLHSATADRGAKADLARSLGITRQGMNGWLSGKTSPNAETTLRLLRWVLIAEAKQKKEPPGAETPRGEKTRKRKSKSDENTQSDHTEN